MAARSVSAHRLTAVLNRISHHCFGLADQLVVSAASFITAVIVGRWAGASELGIYGTAVSLVATILAMQDGIILYPYAVRRLNDGPGKELRFPVLLSLSFSSAILCLLALGALVVAIFGGERALVATAWVLALVAPLVLFKDLQRRFAFIQLRMVEALTLDLLAAMMQIAIIAGLARYQLISASRACFALGVASLIAILPLLNRLKAGFSLSSIGSSSALAQHWKLGKWVLLSRTMLQLQGYCAMWLLVGFGGMTTAGIYTACLGIIAFANPILFGIGNILMPRSLTAWKASGAAGLFNQVRFDTLVIGCAMVAFTLAIALSGDMLMALLYGGHEFSGQLHVLILLALSAAVTGIGFPATNALSAIERPQAVALAALSAIILTVFLSAILIVEFGLLGAALSAFVGNALSTMIRWLALGHFLRVDASANLARQALSCVLPEADAANTKLSKIGDGDHAIAYLAHLGKSIPSEAMPNNVVIKLYKADADLDLAKIRAQRDALASLYAALDSYRSDGWRMCVPVPVGLCERPTALVMTAMSGSHIDEWLALGPTVDEVSVAAQAFAKGLESAWRRGRLHGDLGFQNVLIDVSAKKICFIDPGTFESCSVCGDCAYDPRTLDLAHFLYSYAVEDTRQIAMARRTRKLKKQFVETVLQSALRVSSSNQEDSSLLERVQACADVHISETLTLSPTLRGAWRVYLKYRTTQVIQRVLQGLRTNVDATSLLWSETTDDRAKASAIEHQ